jgi:hypothetical protein
VNDVMANPALIESSLARTAEVCREAYQSAVFALPRNTSSIRRRVPSLVSPGKSSRSKKRASVISAVGVNCPGKNCLTT